MKINRDFEATTDLSANPAAPRAPAPKPRRDKRGGLRGELRGALRAVMTPLAAGVMALGLFSATADAQQRTPRGAFTESPGNRSLPQVELTPGLLYEFLAAEIAGQRGASTVALQKYLEIARRVRDPRVAQRAAEIAFYQRDNVRALEAAQLWVELDADSLDARQTLSGILINAGRGSEAVPHLQRLISAESTNAGEAFLQINRLFSRNPDKKATLEVIRALAAKYQNLAEARGAVAQAAINAGDEELALSEARAAARLKPDWEFPVVLSAQLVGKKVPATGISELRAYLERNPKSTEARLALARALIADRKYTEARAEFQRAEQEAPDNPDVLYALGLLALDAKEYAAAEGYLKKLLTREPRDPNQIYLYLGQIAEEQKKFVEARRWYAQVARGDQYFPAQSRIAQSFAKEGKIAEGRAHLQGIVPVNNSQRAQVVLAEAQLLRDANQHKEAFELLERSLERLPNNTDLLYETAMTAEKIERMDIAESNWRKVIQLKPDFAHAYNALGYSLADRNERLNEARELIEKALAIAPNDAMIIDSMGWVMYRLGDLPRAYELLKRAYDLMPDAEIGAHLGEVLWQMNRRAEAERIWRDATARSPTNETLKNTIKRFKPN